VAEKDNRIVSALMSWRTGSIVGLHCLATSREYRGQGVARSFVCEVMARQSSSGARRFFLHTTPRGRQFAEGIGYRPAGLPHGFAINDNDNTSTFRDQ
jgi:citrate lyase synthetase